MSIDSLAVADGARTEAARRRTFAVISHPDAGKSTLTEASLKDRRTLAEEGVITVVAIVDADTGQLVEPPDFLARGFVHGDTTFDDVVPLIEKALARAAEEGVGSALQLEQLIARTVGTWAHRAHRRSPMIIPVVVDA